MSRPALTIAIPAYDEVECLEAVVSRCRETMARLGESYEILIVDDGSADGTGALADLLATRWSEVRVIHHARNLGFAGAQRTLYRNARGVWLFLLPADGQTDIADIDRFLAHRDHADVVVSYRLARPDPWYRHVSSKVFHLMMRHLFGIKLREISSAKLYPVDRLQQLPIRSKPGTATLETEVIFRLLAQGARFEQVGCPFHRRQGGTAKGARLSMLVRTFVALLQLRLALHRENLRTGHVALEPAPSGPADKTSV